MDYKQIIQDYVSGHPNPDTNYLPTLVLTSEGSNSMYGKYIRYYLPNEGLIYINDTSAFNNKPQLLSGRMLSPYKWNEYWNSYKFFYARFVEESNMLELGRVRINALHPNKKLMMDIRPFEWEDRFFIFSDHISVYDQNGEQIWKDKDGKFYNKTLFHWFRDTYNLCKSLQFYYGTKDIISITEFNKMLTKLGANTIESGWSLQHAYQTMYPRNPSKVAEKFATALSATLKPIKAYESIFEGTYKKIAGKTGWNSYEINDIHWVAEKIDDDNYVFRRFNIDDNKRKEIINAYYKETVISLIPPEWMNTESMRVYLKSNGDYTIKIMRDKTWTSITLRELTGYCDTVGIINFKSFESCPFITEEFKIAKEYWIDSTSESHYKTFMFIKMIIRMKSNPIYLQIYKEGFNNLFKELLIKGNNNVLYKISNSKDLYKTTHLSKEQLALTDKMLPHLKALRQHPTTTMDKSDLIDSTSWYLNVSAIHHDVMDVLFHLYCDDVQTLPINEFNAYYRRLLYMIGTSRNWRRKWFGETSEEDTPYLLGNLKKILQLVKDNNDLFIHFLRTTESHFNSLPCDKTIDQKFFDKINTADDIRRLTA